MEPGNLLSKPEKDSNIYARRVDAARWLASGVPRMQIVDKLKKHHGISPRQAHLDINVAREQILPAIHDLGDIEECVAEGLALVEDHYQQAMSTGAWGAATMALKMKIAILGCNADQRLARERLELERTAARLRELSLRREENKQALGELADTDDSTLAQMVKDLQKGGQTL